PAREHPPFAGQDRHGVPGGDARVPGAALGQAGGRADLVHQGSKVARSHTVITAEGTAEEREDSEVNYLNAKKGIWSWLTTIDHKRIGVMYLSSTVAALIVGGIVALVVRLELFTPGRTIMSAETYNQAFTPHGAIMVFLFIIPSIPAALGNFLLPIMIGAKDVAFPKLNLFSLY